MLDTRCLWCLDGPTGVDWRRHVHGARGRSVGDSAARRGSVARDEVGAVVVTDIGHPLPDPAWPTLVSDAQAAGWLHRLRSRDHKGDRGRVVIVGGDAGMVGAVRMAGRSAFGAGAGLVHVVAPRDSVAALGQAEPDLQTLAHALDQPPSEALLELVRRATRWSSAGLGRDRRGAPYRGNRERGPGRVRTPMRS